jgi:hypothetical protein
MIVGNARVSTKEQKLGFQHDDLNPAFDASVDQTHRSNLERGIRRALNGQFMYLPTAAWWCGRMRWVP